MPFWKKPPVVEQPKYYRITCLNLRCMEQFEHHEMLFQLTPPQDVIDHRNAKLLSGVAGAASPANNLSRFQKAQKTSDESEFDDDDDDYGEGSPAADNKIAAENFVASNSEAAVKRLDEMIKYYYEEPMFGHESGDGEPNYIKISSSQAQEPYGRDFPRPAYREYLRGDPATNYVVSIVDCYGKKTQKVVCPYCHTPLFSSLVGTYETFVVPVLGVSQSGKTVLLANSFKSFIKNTSPKMLENGSLFESPEMRKYLAEVSKRIMKGDEIASTLSPELIMYEMESKNRKILMCTFDLPGEHIANEKFEDFRKNELSKLLHRANGMIIIICPEQIESISRVDLNAIDNQGDKRSMKAFADMIRLLSHEADPQGIVQRNNLPICFIMTMLDLFKFNDGVNYKIDVSKTGSVITEMLYGKKEDGSDGIINRAEIPYIKEYSEIIGSVNMGVIERYAQQTRELFRELMPTEFHAILNRFAGAEHNVCCFAMSSQGNDIKDNIDRPPIRPNEVFYWLFAKMGIYKKPGIGEPNQKKR